MTKKSLRVPTFNGSNFYLPVWLEEGGDVVFLLIDKTKPDIVFPRELIENLPLIKKVKRIKGLKTDYYVDEVIVPRLRFGPWWLTNVKVSLCDKCQIRGGQTLLNLLHMTEWNRFGVDFLMFSQ